MKESEYITDFDDMSIWGFIGGMGLTVFKWLGWKVLLVIALIVVL